MPCWVCDYPDCGHVWLAGTETLPGQCAKCRRRGWNQPTGQARIVDAERQKKEAAHYAVLKALKHGVLVKQPCEECGTVERVEGHHEDYDAPLVVVWLCRRHHRLRHSPRVRPRPQIENDQAAWLLLPTVAEAQANSAARPAHDPKTCRVYRCGACLKAQHHDPKRGL